MRASLLQRIVWRAILGVGTQAASHIPISETNADLPAGPVLLASSRRPAFAAPESRPTRTAKLGAVSR